MLIVVVVPMTVRSPSITQFPVVFKFPPTVTSLLKSPVVAPVKAPAVKVATPSVKVDALNNPKLTKFLSLSTINTFDPRAVPLVTPSIKSKCADVISPSFKESAFTIDAVDAAGINNGSI